MPGSIASAVALTHPAVAYVRDSLTLLFLGQPDRTRRYLAVYGAFWDESGVNKTDPWLTVAGFLSTADGWVDFTSEWQAVLDRFQIPVFHANRFNAPGASEYAGWTQERHVECSKALVDVIVRHVVGSVGISVPGPAFRKAILPRHKGRVGHPYAIASHTCMVEAAELLLGNLKLTDVTLNHTFAAGAEGRGELMDASDWEMMRPERVEHLALGAITFGQQSQFLPLQAADFLAWELNRLQRQEGKTTVSTIRTSLRRFWELPHRWFHFEEDHVGAQTLISLGVQWGLTEARRAARRSRRRSTHDR